VDDLLRWSGTTGYVAYDLVVKYFLLLDDRDVRQLWLDQLELDEEARAVANNLINALRDAVPWAIGAIEQHLVGAGRSDFSRKMLGATAAAIREAMNKEAFQMAEARGVSALGGLYYHERANGEAKGYVALHARLLNANLLVEPALLLRLAVEVRDHDPNREAWPEVLVRLGAALIELLGPRRQLDDADVAAVQRDDPSTEHVRALLTEAMDLAVELAKKKNLRVHAAQEIAAQRVPLKKVNGKAVGPKMRLQIMRSAPEKLWAAMEESRRTGSKTKPKNGSGSKHRT
jgi:hypothetical protein